jgi:hypothetical protein
VSACRDNHLKRRFRFQSTGFEFEEPINIDCNRPQHWGQLRPQNPDAESAMENTTRTANMRQPYHCGDPSRGYLGQIEDNWYKSCSRQGSKRGTPNLPYLDLKMGDEMGWGGERRNLLKLLGIYITIPPIRYPH